MKYNLSQKLKYNLKPEVEVQPEPEVKATSEEDQKEIERIEALIKISKDPYEISIGKEVIKRLLSK